MQSHIPRGDDELPVQFAIALSYATYLLTGTVLTVMGPLIPEIMRHFAVSYVTIGTAMVLNSVAYLPAVLLGGFVCGRYGAHRVVLYGLALMALGYGTIAFADRWWLFVIGYCAGGGLGFGLLEAGLNAMVMQHAGLQQGAALNWLHVYAAGGAMAGPLIGRGLVALSGKWQLVYLLLAVLFAGATFVFAAVHLPLPSQLAQEEKPQWGAMARSLLHPVIGVLAAAMTFYVGAEIGLSSWMYSYIVSEVGGGALLGAALNSLFWCGLGLGRLVSARLSEKMGYERYLLYSTFAAALTLAPALLWRHPVVATLSFFSTGLLFAGSFPTILAVGGTVVPGQSGPVAGTLIFFAGVGTMVFPPTMGYIADVWGIWQAMALAFCCTAALAVSTVFLKWKAKAAPLADAA